MGPIQPIMTLMEMGCQMAGRPIMVYNLPIQVMPVRTRMGMVMTRIVTVLFLHWRATLTLRNS